MEYLPDELWLLIFDYLHYVDILQAFLQINQRFQRLVLPYIYHIDLSHVSFPRYDRFCQDVFSRHSAAIRSLKLKNHDQFGLFKEHILTIKNSLTRLTLDSDDFFPRARHEDEVLFYLEHLKDFPILTDLQLIGLFDSITYPKLFGYVTQIPSLQKLTILTEPNSTVTPHKIQHDVPGIQQMQHLQVIKIHLIDFSDLIYLLQTANQVREIFMSVCQIDYPKHLMESTVSVHRSTLQKLHMELAVTYTKRLLHCKFAELIEFFDELFHRFHIELQSLTLLLSIAVSKSNIFFVDLDELKWFRTIQTFQYAIHTTDLPTSVDGFENVEHLPDGTHLLYSTRRPISFIDARYPSYYSDLRIIGHTPWESIYNAYDLSVSAVSPPDVPFAFKLLKLRKLTGYRLSDRTARELFHTVVLISPNLRSVKFSYNSSEELKETLQLCRKSLREVTSLECDNYAFYATFFADLAEVMPRLRHLKLCGADLSHVFSPEMMVNQIEQHCPHLSTLHCINLKHGLESDGDESQAYEKFIELLRDRQKDNHLFFSSGIFSSCGDYTNVWF